MKRKTAVGGAAARRPLRPRAVPQTGVDERDAAWREKEVRKIFHKLSPFEVAPPPAWLGLTTPDRIYPGRCFDRSFRFAVEVRLTFGVTDPAADDIWLVHGEYWEGQPHAWVELPGDVVFDGTNQRFYDRRGYYEAVSASPWYMYSPFATCVIAKHMPRHPDGTIQLDNWHDLLHLPRADLKNPIRIGYPDVIPFLEKSGLKPQPARPTCGRKKARPAT